MTYVALLRGINVGGKNKVEMSRLKSTFEGVGLTDVRTFINSGNVMFTNRRRKPASLKPLIERAIADEFGFPVEVVLRDLDQMVSVVEATPASWTDDSTMRCYVMFLWEKVDDPSVLDRLTIKKDLDDMKYLPGVIIWRVDRDVLTRSGMMKLTSDALYKSMTIRSINTVRKLVELMAEAT